MDTNYIPGKVPPQAVDLEEAVLGALMLESHRLPEIVGTISAESFYKETHQILYRAIVRLYDKGEPVDMLTVTEELRASGELESAGGAYYITTLTNRISSSANIQYHAAIVKQAFIKRDIIRVSSEAIEQAYDATVDPFECLDSLERGITVINSSAASGGSMRPIGSILQDVETDARNRERLYKSGQCTGINTGILRLNKHTSGWQNGDLVILAGRPSMGKTALMLHHAISARVPVCIYSLEMNDVSLVNRMVLSMSEIDPGRFRAGAMTDLDWSEFNRATTALNALPIHIDENPACSTRYIKAHSKVMKDRGLCDMVMVDYLQLIDMRSDQRGRNREQEVSQAAREFKIIAKDLNVPVILLSQLSRECEKRSDKKPILSDLRESGAIEQDADVVIFAYRPAYYNEQDQPGIGYEIIAKGRNIGIGEIPFAHNESMTKIYDHDETSVPDGYSGKSLAINYPF